ncbi:MAG: cell division protein FtsZ [Candidatus Manganitrophaceae bacterium]
MFLFDEEEQETTSAKIRVVGVGGGGCNAVNNMIHCGLQGVDFIAANTDVQVLKINRAANKIQIGAKLTRGLGAGAKPQVGRESALEAVDQIREMLAGADMVFVTAGMGGGTGTGAAPIIAEVAKEMGALTIGVVTKPFQFEGAKRLQQAEEGVMEMKKACHTVIIIPNQRLLNVVEKGMSLKNSFLVVDDILKQAVQGISDLITIPGLINVDFADVRTIMSHTGRAVMGMGVSKGENRAIDAAQKAISSPLLEDSSIEGARGVLINITGGSDLSLSEVDDASSIIQKSVDPDANIIFGSVISEGLTDEIKVTVIATGFEENVKSEVSVEGEDRPIRRTGQRPLGGSYLRRVVREGAGKETARLDGEDEWDVPTFLRKQAD